MVPFCLVLLILCCILLCCPVFAGPTPFGAGGVGPSTLKKALKARQIILVNPICILVLVLEPSETFLPGLANWRSGTRGPMDIVQGKARKIQLVECKEEPSAEKNDSSSGPIITMYQSGLVMNA
ncbi:predicted protein [Plenodomus lingam JN3]|uniref:Predicted protein n=1 Tax=Leptosphaeria maculans (strain JN3 / isolate v23.1.3 / race Av1-4-5-6-7-8) TaxID=985895 RepID=E4ZMR0_LEPMJ|nr:predicted protein [Plenodomus lingam JN3]CBX92513.1 predicted protein [Plenodomus lingam JN3]